MCVWKNTSHRDTDGNAIWFAVGVWILDVLVWSGSGDDDEKNPDINHRQPEPSSIYALLTVVDTKPKRAVNTSHTYPEQVPFDILQPRQKQRFRKPDTGRYVVDKKNENTCNT